MYPTHPTTFDLHRPQTLDEALGLLGADRDARPLAGGHSLLPAMKLRVASPSTLVDLGRVPGLAGIVLEGDELVIGACTTHAAVAASATVRSSCPVLAETAAGIGDLQVRNRGTIGGSLAHADPAADYPTVVSVLGATVVTAASGGGRSFAAASLPTGVFETTLEPGELITAVRVPVTQPGTGAAYVKHAHPASGYAVVGAAALVTLQGGACTAARLVVGGVAGTPVVVPIDGLVGAEPTAEAIASATAGVPDTVGEGLADVYASSEYRLHLTGVLARRALAAAAARAG